MSHQNGKTAKVGVVGCGGIAQIIHIPILVNLEDAEVVAICDPDPRKTAFLSERFGLTAIFTDIEEMFRKVEIDAVLILTPNNMHLPMSLIALRNGAHVFVERPCTRTYKEARQLADAAKKFDRQVMVGMHSRFRSDIRTIKGFIDNQALGEIFFMRGEWLQSEFQGGKQPWLLKKNVSGGGVILDLLIQMLDTSWWLAGKPDLLAVKAFSRQIDKRISVEDFCSAYFRFTEDLHMSFTVSWNFPIPNDRFSAEIFGTSGTASVNPLSIEKAYRGKTLDVTPHLYEHRRRNLFKRAYVDEITHFINLVQGKENAPQSSLEDALKIMKMIDMVYESIKSGREMPARHS